MGVTGRPRYWEWRAELEHSRDRLVAAVVGLSMVCLVLIGVIGWLARRPVPIYYVSAAVGTAWPGNVPDPVVGEFGSRVVALLGNLTPTSASQVYSLATRYLTPAMATRLAGQAKEDLAAIEAQQLGTAFAQTDVRVESGARGGEWHLLVSGARTAWAGAQLLSQGPVQYEARVVRVQPTDLNPYGLALDSIQLLKVSPRTQSASEEVRRE